MTRSTETSHVLKLIPDYALGLISGEDAHWVDAHIAGCVECRIALSEEQNIMRSVKATLSKASAPEGDRIRELMPEAPSSARARGRWPLMSPGLAAAAVMVLMIFSALALYAVQQPGAWGLSAPTVRSTSVLFTDTPTQTATRELTATAEGLGARTIPPASPIPGPDRLSAPAPAMVPVPAAPLLH